MKGKLENEVKRLLQGLVRIPSVNPRDDKRPEGIWGEKKLAEYVAGALKNRGIPASLEYASPGRPNVFARIEPRGLPRRRILIEAHLDTVEIEGMTIPPFSGRFAAGRIYGRGSCDCKAPLAAMICALGILAKNKIKSEISFCAAAGEEHDMLGAQYLMKRRRGFDWAIVGEATDQNIAIGHKGALRWLLTTFGVAVHGSRPEAGVNAVYKMSDFIQLLNKKIIKKKRKRHPLLGGPVFNLGKIWGGSAFNIVPARCTVMLERRFLPEEKIAELTRELRSFLEGMRKKDGQFRYQLKPVNFYPAMEISADEELVRLLQATVRKYCPRSRLIGMKGATDAGVYSRFGIPSVVFGPGDGKKFAHTANESVRLAEVAKSALILKDFLENN